jgi:hypothetical protein
MAATSPDIDTHAVRELILYADNTSALYTSKLSTIEYVQRRIKTGTYDPTKAPKLWRYWIDAAARMYRKELGGASFTFSPSVRQAAAAEVAEREYAELTGE